MVLSPTEIWIMLEHTEYLKMLISLIAIVNPLGAIPVFLTLTLHETNAERKRIAKMVAVSVCIILLVSLFIGELLLSFFGISIDSFRVAGGILLLLMAISMLHARPSGTAQTDEEILEGASKESVAVVPLAMPVLAGPGGISTVILFAHQGSDVGHYMLVAADIVILCMVLWIALLLMPWITGRLQNTGINIFTRVMGLILTAIAVEFIANGIKGLFPGVL